MEENILPKELISEIVDRLEENMVKERKLEEWFLELNRIKKVIGRHRETIERARKFLADICEKLEILFDEDMRDIVNLEYKINEEHLEHYGDRVVIIECKKFEIRIFFRNEDSELRRFVSSSEMEVEYSHPLMKRDDVFYYVNNNYFVNKDIIEVFFEL